MIYWMDFAIEKVADQILGAFLVCDSNNGKPVGSQSQDEWAESRVQETRQVQRPARMVGLNGLESTSDDMDVDSNSRCFELRAGGRDV